MTEALSRLWCILRWWHRRKTDGKTFIACENCKRVWWFHQPQEGRKP
jgi:hypothetical protein